MSKQLVAFMHAQKEQCLGLLVSMGLFCFTLASCGMMLAKQDSRDFYASTVLVGRVSAASAGDKPVVVAAYEKRGDRMVIAHSTQIGALADLDDPVFSPAFGERSISRPTAWAGWWYETSSSITAGISRP